MARHKDCPYCAKIVDSSFMRQCCKCSEFGCCNCVGEMCPECAEYYDTLEEEYGYERRHDSQRTECEND